MPGVGPYRPVSRMRFVLFYHSLVSDWNHGNAHFLRGIASELLRRGHSVQVFEPAWGWSLTNLLTEQGLEPLLSFQREYPELRSEFYCPAFLDVGRAVDGADVVIVHEWTDPALVARLGAHRRRNGGYRLLFHDTHHLAVTEPDRLPVHALADYDGVLAFGASLRDLYLSNGWTAAAWAWQEGADHRRFRPVGGEHRGDLIWIGNWGDGERTQEVEEFLLRPVRELGLTVRVHGVRYPLEGRAALERVGIEYGGWLPNYAVPAAVAGFRFTIHVPRRPYAEALPGIPTIRVFEALACGIPLITAPWEDREGLFSAGEDYLLARDGREMLEHMRLLRDDPDQATRLARNGRRTIEARHTCVHRVDELITILRGLQGGSDGWRLSDVAVAGSRRLATGEGRG